MGATMLAASALVVVVLVLSSGAHAGYPSQAEAPIIGIVTEPVAYSVCVSAELQFAKQQEDAHPFVNLNGKKVTPAEAKDMLSKMHDKNLNTHTNRGGAIPEGIMPENNNRKHMAFGDPTMPPSGNFSGCVWSIYVKWLEAAGIRVVPVPWNSKPATLDWYFDRLNGFLFPGGILSGAQKYIDEYFPTVQYIFNKTIEANNKGDPMVMWGTCQGFEMLNAAAAGTPSAVESGFKGTDGPTMMANNFTSYATGSRMYADAPANIKEYMSNYNTTLNWHSKGITPQEFVAGNPQAKPFPRLRELLRPLTTTNDATGRAFVSSVEGVSAHVYGVQFHPERPEFEFDNDRIGHSLKAIEVSQYLGRFLASQLRLNKHSFDTPEQGNDLTIANYPPHNDGWGIEVYYV